MTLYGKIDVSAGSYDRGGAASSMMMVNTGVGQTSRLGIRGTEKLEGGMNAIFNIEGGLEMDTGTPLALTFTRESWGGLQGGFGEIRLGRTLTPSFHADALGDIMTYSFFGGQGNWSSGGGGACATVSTATANPSSAAVSTTVGAAGATPSSTTVSSVNTAILNAQSPTQWACQGTSPTAYDTRYSNAILWMSPSISGLVIRGMVAFGERDNTVGTGVVTSSSSGTSAQGAPAVGAAVPKSSGNAFDVSGIYTAGPLGVALAYQDGKGGNNAASRKVTTLAGSYTIGDIGIKGGWAKSDAGDRLGSAKMELEKKNIGASYKVGVGSVMVAFTQLDGKNFATAGETRKANVLGLAYAHPVSKNTTLYGTYGRTDNRNATSTYALYAGAPSFSPSAAGADVAGLAAGIIHNF